MAMRTVLKGSLRKLGRQQRGLQGLVGMTEEKMLVKFKWNGLFPKITRSCSMLTRSPS